MLLRFRTDKSIEINERPSKSVRCSIQAEPETLFGYPRPRFAGAIGIRIVHTRSPVVRAAWPLVLSTAQRRSRPHSSLLIVEEQDTSKATTAVKGGRDGEDPVRALRRSH